MGLLRSLTCGYLPTESEGRDRRGDPQTWRKWHALGPKEWSRGSLQDVSTAKEHNSGPVNVVYHC